MLRGASSRSLGGWYLQGYSAAQVMRSWYTLTHTRLERKTDHALPIMNASLAGTYDCRA